jgi:hypothetical protein
MNMRWAGNLIAALVFSSAAFSLDVPSDSLLLKFFRARLTIEKPREVEYFCEVDLLTDTLICVAVDSILPLRKPEIRDCAGCISPLALTREILFLPFELAAMRFDSVSVNKSRTNIGGIMCWKMRLVKGSEKFSAFLSADGFYKVIRVEKNRAGSRPDDTWDFIEIEKGKDIPIRVTRISKLYWGENEIDVVSKRELKIGSKGFK